MKIRALIGVWLVALMGLAMCGASLPDIGLSSNRGKMAVGLKTSLANGGGVAAGWDTVTVIFHTQARATGGLFPVPTNPTAIATDTTRIGDLNRRLLGRGAYSIRGGADDVGAASRADSARTVRLGTGFACPTFAWTTLDQGDQDGFYGSQFWYMKDSMRQRVKADSTVVLRQKIGNTSGSRQAMLFYIPFENHIPAGSTVVSASVNFASYNALTFSYLDTMISVLMDKSTDDEWYKVKGGTGLNAASANYAKASWLYQNDTNASGTVWGGSQANAWTPTLADRKYYWGMGDYSDWSSTEKGQAATDTLARRSNVACDITDCVQQAVAGHTNNGIMMLLNRTSTVETQRLPFGWDNYSSAINRTPYVVVKYITKRYQPPFGTSDLAFVFTTDDYIESANSAFTDTFNAHGGVYTMFGARKHVDHSGGKQSGMDSLLTWLGQGFEIGTHSRQHRDPAGLTYWEQSRPGKVWDQTARGQVWFDAEPLWLHALADSATGDSLKSHPQFGKSMALPNNTISMGVQRVLSDLGYLSVRGNSASTYDRSKYYTLLTWAPAYGDTLLQIPQQSQRRPRNVMMLPYAMTANYFVGPPSRAACDADSVRHNMRRALYQWRGQGRCDFTMLTHDVKATNPAYSGFGYADGIDPVELGAMLDVVDEIGARYMTASDLGRWRRVTAQAIDTPAGFYNAPVSDDSAKYFATDETWYKPNGIDNRWIPSIRTPRAVVNSFDSTAPPAPASALAYGQNGSAVLTWAPSATAEAVSYRIYRFFDNAADTTLVGTSNTPFYQDLTAVNGSPHNYYVTAVDEAGNESDPTASFATTPGTIISLPRPAYFTFWHEDPANDGPLPQDDVNKLAAYDMVAGSPHSLEGVGNEPAFDGLLGRIRAINPDFIHLNYWTSFCLYTYWADADTSHVQKKIWDYVASFADSTGFGLDESGDPAHGDDYPYQMYANVMRPTMADTIAKFLVRSLANSNMDGEYTGFFIDDSDTTLSEWMCNGDDCGDLIDFDQDGTTFSEGVNGDAQEKAAFRAWNVRFIRALRREFAERNMPNRLIAANTTYGRKAVPETYDTEYLALLDGAMNEGWNRYWPGPTVPTDTDKWDLAVGWTGMLTHAQTAPPLVMWNAHADSSMQYMNEVAAYANGGLVNVNSPTDLLGATAVHPIGRKIAALAPGNFATVAYDTVAGNATADTLRVETGNVVARIVMGRNTGDPSNQYAVWPYLITDNTKSPDDVGYYLSRSAFWPLPEDEGPPVIAQSQILTGDRMLTLAIGVGLDGQPPGDFSHFSIAREYKIGATAYYDTFTVDPDTLVMVNGTTNSWWWYDTGLTNGRQYKYKVFLVDMLGNIGDPAPQVTQTPGDIAPPAVPADLVASGGDGFVDLDWPGVSAADLVGYQISRATDDGGAPGSFAVTDTVTISAHQDSTAISGNIYHYYVKSLDDDDNISAESDTAFGGWIGSPPATYLAPQLVRVVPNYTATATAVLVYPPQDVTGLTGYTVYRGPWNGVAATDTTDCIKRISINATPDSYNAHTFIDNTANTTPDSAFQYTAVALYSGNRSKKYSPPAGAFTDGGFAATTPTLAAFGNGTNILLAVGTVSGADSTRVYRGTSAVAQTSLASINAANNPYTDTTAAANTDYWYKVRQYDVQTAAWSNYSTVSGPVRWTSVPSGTPSISGVNEGVDNTVQHGEAVVIAGSNFGVNDVAADFSDGFESGAFQSPWNLSDGGYSQGFSTVVAAGANARHGASSYVLKTSFPSTSGNAHQCIYRDPFTTLYAQYWVKLDNNFDFGGPGSSNNYGPTELANVKFFRLWPYGSSQEDFVTAFHKYLTTHGAVVEVENTDPYPHSWYAWGGFANPGEFTKNVWHLFQFEYRSSSGLGVADGVFKWTVDGDVKFSRSDIVTMKNTNTPKDEVWLGFGDTTSGWNYDGANDVYFDDIYITPTFARIEIGNASTYAACTHREIQIPTAWTATSVTVTANTGSFTDAETVYLFVIDADGTASPGQLVTIDNP